jgi:hypothetical protein
MIGLQIDTDAMRPLIREIVQAVLAETASENNTIGDARLCYSEAEAAALLGVGCHVLRDERRRGRIVASSIVGRRVRYQRSDLLQYLQDRRQSRTEGQT